MIHFKTLSILLDEREPPNKSEVFISHYSKAIEAVTQIILKKNMHLRKYNFGFKEVDLGNKYCSYTFHHHRTQQTK